MHTLVKTLFFSSLILIAAAFWQRNALPPPDGLVDDDFELLKAASRTWRNLGRLGLLLWVISIVAWLCLPMRPV